MASTALQDFGQPLILEDFIPVTQPVSTTSPSLCAICHAIVSQSKKCSGCKDIIYCSKECQTADWSQHKTLCKPFTRSSRPTADHRRALFFGADQARPRFIWLQYGTDGISLNIMECFPNIAKDDIKIIAFHNRFLPYWIQLSYDSSNNSNHNLDSNAAIQFAFRGPVVAIAYDAEEGLSKPALDADTRMLGPILEYAKLRAEYAGPVFVEQPQERYTEDEWAKILKEAAANQRGI